MVISAVKRRQFWVVISLVKTSSLAWLLVWLKRGSFGLLLV